MFNLVPAFPLDGGRMTRAIVWRVTGDKQRGTRTAAKLGQGFGLLVAGLGVWLLLAYRSFTGLWLIAIAFLLYQSARAALVQTALSARIEGVRVADIMDRQPVAIPSRTGGRARRSTSSSCATGGRGSRWSTTSRRFLGIARQERLTAAQDRGEDWLTVEAVLEPEQDGGWQVNEDRPITEVLSSENLGPARGADGRRRRRRAPRRGHRRAGAPGAPGRVRLARPAGVDADGRPAAPVSEPPRARRAASCEALRSIESSRSW